jgi:hypothetical protein
MPFHPAYPTAADLSRETFAIARDRNDQHTLHQLRAIVCKALERTARCDDLHHPDRHWAGATELTETLLGELANIDGELVRLRTGPVVIEDEG